MYRHHHHQWGDFDRKRDNQFISEGLADAVALWQKPFYFQSGFGRRGSSLKLLWQNGIRNHLYTPGPKGTLIIPQWN